MSPISESEKVTDDAPTLSYANPGPRRRVAVILIVGLLTGAIADILLAVCIFFSRNWQVAGRYISTRNVPIEPMFYASLLFGIIAIFASGLGMTRPSRKTLKLIALLPPVIYWAGFAYVAWFRLI